VNPGPLARQLAPRLAWRLTRCLTWCLTPTPDLAPAARRVAAAPRPL